MCEHEEQANNVTTENKDTFKRPQTVSMRRSRRKAGRLLTNLYGHTQDEPFSGMHIAKDGDLKVMGPDFFNIIDIIFY
jgi:hypothetical protein